MCISSKFAICLKFYLSLKNVGSETKSWIRPWRSAFGMDHNADSTSIWHSPAHSQYPSEANVDFNKSIYQIFFGTHHFDNTGKMYSLASTTQRGPRQAQLLTPASIPKTCMHFICIVQLRYIIS